MKKIIIAILLSLILIPLTASAAGLVPCGGSPRCCETAAEIADPTRYKCSTDPNDCEPRCVLCHLFVMFDSALDFVLFRLIPPVAVLMLVWGGAKLYLVAENPGEVADVKKLITSVIIGLVIAYSAWLIINLFFVFIDLSTFGLSFTGPDKWFKIYCPVP
ncbi:MAG: pilin [bacterium]